ncbi:MAG: N-acetylmuramoyl-L-alanine amidase [Kaiparowitsia implicata GSE-PSE-MK54-09C]|jgi:N-acetylmuramoyl-L-alanine amidase|nr:N-acetylmuramoyl-L-alanine amidase [Kaiparowitsia implicata GSE-PSE-MK54-09C]
MVGVALMLMLATPASANSLRSWQYDTRNQQLTFTTQQDVQPRAQLIFNPTRLVIDLPGVRVGAPRTQAGSAGIREIRTGQVTADAARLVVELEPGYTLDPQQVAFRGQSPTDWTVQLPTPTRTAAASPPSAAIAQPSSEQDRSSEMAESADVADEELDNADETDETDETDTIDAAAVDEAVAVPPSPASTSPNRFDRPGTQSDASVDDSTAALIQTIRLTGDGLFVLTQGEVSRARVRRERGDRRIFVDLENTRLPERLLDQTEPINRFGVTQIRYTQRSSDPPTTRLELELERPNPNWQASVSPLGGGVVLLPGRQAEANREADMEADMEAAPTPTPSPDMAADPEGSTDIPVTRPVVEPTITAITLARNGASLEIQGNYPLDFEVERDRSNRYRFTFPNTQAARGAMRVDVTQSSRIVAINLQERQGALELDLELAPDVEIPQIPQAEGRFGTRSPNLTLPLARPHWQPNDPVPPVRLPDLSRRNLTVVLDPGHGGRDPGAVGISGLQEIQVVNSITPQVAALLEQAGVRVVLTRRDNTTLDLEPRVRLAEQANATIFVSIHANAISLSRPDVNGIETFYASGQGQVLAQAIQDSLIEATGSPSRGARSARFYVIRRTSMPAALVEVGFVTGAEDAPRMRDERYRALLAQAIARGILQYLQ